MMKMPSNEGLDGLVQQVPYQHSALHVAASLGYLSTM